MTTLLAFIQGRMLATTVTISILCVVATSSLSAEGLGADDSAGITVSEAALILDETAPQVADKVAKHVNSIAGQILMDIGPSVMFNIYRNYAPNHWGLPDVRGEFESRVELAIDRIANEPDDKILIEALVNLGQPGLHLLLISSEYKEGITHRLQGLAADSPEFVSRMIHLLREERSMLEIAASDNLQAPIRRLLERLNSRELPARFFGAYAGKSAGSDVLLKVLEILPMERRLEFLSSINEGTEPLHLMAWLNFWAGQAPSHFLIRRLNLPQEWIEYQIEAGYVWWLKEIAVILDGYSRAQVVASNIEQTEWSQLRRGVLEHEGDRWWVQDMWLQGTLDEQNHPYSTYLRRWMTDLTPRLQLEIVNIHPEVGLTGLVVEIVGNAFGDLRQTDCEPTYGQAEFLNLLIMALVRLDSTTSIQSLEELSRWMSECGQHQWLSFLSDHLQYDAHNSFESRSPGALDLMARILADNQEFEIVDVIVLKRLGEVAPELRERLLRSRVAAWRSGISRQVGAGIPFVNNSWEICGPIAGLLVSYGYRIFDDWEEVYKSLWQTGNDRPVPTGCDGSLVQAAVVDDEGRGIMGLLALWQHRNVEVQWYSSLIVDVVAADGRDSDIRRKVLLEYLEDSAIWDQLSTERRQLLTGEIKLDWD